MRGGMTILLGAAAVASAGCTAKTGQIQVRSLANPASKLGEGSERLAEARGQLALGNVGLAIEGFHVALREQPDSIEAMGGLASCYDSMGRSDLSRQYYEAALAVAPRNPAVLNAFAGSLEAQGERVEAMALRSEAAQASRPTIPAVAVPPPVLAAVKTLAPALVAAAPVAPALVAEPLAVPAFIAVSPAAPAFAAPKSAPAVSLALAPAAAVPAPAAPSAPAPVIQAPAVIAMAPQGTSVTIALPPARPVMLAAEVQQVGPTPAAPIAPALTAFQPSGPRLQRLSMGEVALLTSREPIWERPKVVARTAQSTTVHWVALNDSDSRPNIRLLNAARSPGLAARTRAVLMARGWRKIEIGDANSVRESSLIMYPESRQMTGRSLAAQFAFRPGAKQQGNVIVVYLGRDAIPGRGAISRG